MNSLQDAFISYGRADSKQFAQTLNKRLVDLGKTIWFDFDDIPLGVDYQKQIDDGINKADNFLFLISPHSVNSAYCGLEVELALKQHKRIIPLLHVEEISQDTWQQRNPSGTPEDWQTYQSDGKNSSFPNMHPAISKINWIYFREGIDDYEQSFQGLLELLNRQKDYVHQHTVLLNRALNWQHHQKQIKGLLVGRDRQQAEDWLNVRFTEEQPPCVPTDLHCEFITESIKNAHNMMTQVFLSHADANKECSHRIRQILLRAGITTWTYGVDITVGADFEAAMLKGVEEADNFVFLMSSASLKSAYCQKEIDRALACNKRIIPVLVETLNINQIPISLRNIQYVALSSKSIETDFQKRVDELLGILHQEAAYYNEHKVLLTKALKWEQQQHNPCILLQGYELQHAMAWMKIAKKRKLYGPTPLQIEFIKASDRQPPGIAPEVFVSYSRSDSDFARKLNEQLQRQGKRTWFDQESIASGADFQQEIYRGIETSNHFLFILSPSSVNSPYCADEVEYAARLNKRIVTVLHHPVDPAKLHPELAKVQWIDFNAHKSDFTANFEEVLRTLDTDPEHLKIHTRLLVSALEWQNKQRREELLMRGQELADAERWLLKAINKAPHPTPLQREYIASSHRATTKRQRIVVGVLGSLLTIALLGIGEAIWQAIEANQARSRAEQQALNAEIQAESLSIENLLASDLNSQAQWAAVSLGQKLKQLPDQQADQLLPPVRMQALSVLQEVEHLDGFLVRNTLRGHEGRLWNISIAPDGSTVASVGVDSTIQLWDIRGQHLRTLTGHTDKVNNAVFSPDSKTLVSVSVDGSVRLWDVATGQGRETPQKGYGADGLSFAPDGSLFVTGHFDGTINLWDSSGERLRTLNVHEKAVMGMSFAPDSRTFASASWDGTVKLWDAAQGSVLKTLEGHEAEVNSVSFAPDSRILASGSWDSTVKLWDVQTGEELQTLKGHTNRVISVAFSPDGKTVASAGIDRTIKLWDVASGQEIQTLQGHAAPIFGINFAPDGQTIASASWDSTVKLWSPIGLEPQSFTGHTDDVLGVEFSPDDTLVASASLDGTIKLWDTITGNEIKTLDGHDGPVRNLNFSPDGTRLVSGGDDQSVRLWDWQSGKTVQTFVGHGDKVEGVEFSPDGAMIASSSWDGTIKLWDIESGEALQTFEGHDDRVFNAAFSPDGLTLVSASRDKTIKKWDLDSGQELQTLQGHTNEVNRAHFSPDGTLIVSASWDGTVKLWDVETGGEIRTLQGHRDGVRSARFSPDSSMIASVSRDKTVKLWDREGRHLQTLTGHSAEVNEVSFSQDGSAIASASWDGTVQLWTFNLDELITNACAWQQDYLRYGDPTDEQKALCQDFTAP